MPTLSQPYPPLLRLALLRRVPFWAQALALCALFSIAGIAILDDYGVPWDEGAHRRMAIANAKYIATGDIIEHIQPLDPVHRYYGVAFDMPLLLVERALGLQDTRHIYLTRHLLMHLFFIAGGFACGMFAYRTLGSGWVALFAMLMFLLHPRLYAHSFFNVKDIPFAAMLLIALYLAHRAFRKDTLVAFLIAGIGVGLAINMRPFGLMLPPMILAMRALDLWQAGRDERKRVLMTGAAFLAAAVATVYASHPYHWENPLRFIEGVRVLSQHPTLINNLFMGEIYRSDAVPWNYIPVWFAITTPPVALGLGALGATAVCWQAIARPLAALRDRETRFRMLLLGCFVMPVVVVVALQSNIYGGWRHMYFLWAPFCLLAAVGLHCIANIGVGKGIWKIGARLPGRVRGGGLWRGLAYGAACFGLITTLTAMAALHPYEYVYFNALTDTKTPGALAKRYNMDYWKMAQRQLLEYLLARYPDDTPRVYRGAKTFPILPRKDREGIVISRNLNSADYYLPYLNFPNVPREPLLYGIEAYGSAIAIIVAPKNVEAYRAAYDDVVANGTLLTRADFDIYIHNSAIYHLNANCERLTADDIDFWIFLHIFPDDPADLPADSRELGFENFDFRLSAHVAFFDGKCIHKQRLPDYPIARIRTGQNAVDGSAGDKAVWRADIDLAAHAAAQALYESIAAGDYGLPVAQSDFDVYLRGGGLAYVKEPCVLGDADARFFLHIFPADPTELPTDRREHGFENMDFEFAGHGAYAGDKCVATLELPGYAIERIHTGQFVRGDGKVWGAEFPVLR